MGPKLFNYTNEDKKTLKRLSKKYLQNVELYSNPKLDGTIDIKNIRFYDRSIKVHVLFRGKILGRYNRETKWLESSIMKMDNVSKIKINRVIRTFTKNEIRNNLLKLGIETDHYSFEIYKVEWQ